MSLVKLTF